MMDIVWLETNTKKCIESLKNRPNISAEEQGLLNVLNGTLILIENVKYLVNDDYSPLA